MNIKDKIKKIGLTQTIDDIAGNRFSYLKFLWCKLTHRIYFGSYLGASQGKPIRHFYMQEIVREYCKTHKETISLLELGSWAGGSAITWAEAIKRDCPKRGRVICIDPWIDYLDPFSDQEWVHTIARKAVKCDNIYKLFLHNIITSKNSDIISILRGSADEIRPLLKDETFDIIFIDANHAYDFIFNDIKNFTPLLKNGGILCGDDLQLQYKDVDHSSIIQMKNHDVVEDPLTQKRYHPGVTLAVHDYFKDDISVWEGFWAMRKKGDCWEKIFLDVKPNEVIIPKHLR